MSELIRPLHTRVEDARMTLAGFPVAPEPLAFSLSEDARALELRPPDVAVEVREQVIREALDDGLAYHCSENCPHVAEAGWLCAAFVLGRITCALCVQTDWSDPENPVERVPWQGTRGGACTLCGGDGELVSILTRTSHPDGLVYGAHVCVACAAWWPEQEPEQEPLAPPPANAGVTIRTLAGPHRPMDWSGPPVIGVMSDAAPELRDTWLGERADA